MHQERTGRYTVTVNRPWYRPVTVRGVVVRENRCGPVAPTPLVIRLQPTTNAPVVRGFGILGSELHTAVWPYQQRLGSFVDAPGVSPAVTWTSSRPDVASIDQGGLLEAKCRKVAGWTVITARLKADPSIMASVRFGAGEHAPIAVGRSRIRKQVPGTVIEWMRFRRCSGSRGDLRSSLSMTSAACAGLLNAETRQVAS